MRTVFYASAAPTTVAPDDITFEPVVIEVTGAVDRSPGDPMRLVNINDAMLVDAISGDMVYNPLTQLFTMLILEADGSFLVFNMDGLLPAFNAGMTSLPDDPSDYLLDPGNASRGMSLTRTAGLLSFNASWTPSGGFVSDGSFTASVRVVDDPNSEPCPADLNGDGQLNFFDIRAYITLFQAGCP